MVTKILYFYSIGHIATKTCCVDPRTILCSTSSQFPMFNTATFLSRQTDSL